MDKQLWKEISSVFDNSNSLITRVDGNEAVGDRIVKKLMINEDSTLATFVSGMAGMTVNKCIRLYGQGNANMQSIIEINNMLNGTPTRIKGMLIVATDIFGGIYAITSEEINGKVGQVYYFAPDTLEWESLDMKYAQFLYWTVNGNTEDFYASMKWSDWESYADKTGFNQGILIYPFLWAKELVIEEAKKNIVPFVELINVNMDYRKKFFG